MLKGVNKLLKQFSEDINRLPFNFLNVLNVGWEAGTVKLFNDNNEPKIVNISRAGGMAVVVAELPLALVKYGRKSNLFFNTISISPYIDGAMRDDSLSSLVESGLMRKVKEYKSVYCGESFDVEVYEGKTEFGKQYLLKSNAWGEQFGGNMSPYILTLKGQQEKEKLEKSFISSNPHSMSLIEERAYIVFSQAVARIYDMVKADVAILHDYHSGLSVFYNDAIKPVIIGHNMAYQGIMGINSHCLLHKDYERNHIAALEDLSIRLNLDRDVVHNYFRVWTRHDYVGAGNILQAVIRKCKQKTGISATTVSPGYAKELN
ncbi:MAG: glycogen/starch synthase, partial [Pseudomonadota bacterium]